MGEQVKSDFEKKVDLLRFLEDHATQDCKKANLFAMDGSPSPGKWYLENEKEWEQFFIYRGELEPDVMETTFVEKWYKGEEGVKVAFDLDIEQTGQYTLGETNGYYLGTDDTHHQLPQILQHLKNAISEWLKVIVTGRTDVLADAYTGYVKSCAVAILPHGRKHSYHVIFPYIKTTKEDLFNFVVTLKDNPVYSYLSAWIDPSIYKDGRGLRQVFSNKKRGDGRIMLLHHIFQSSWICDEFSMVAKNDEPLFEYECMNVCSIALPPIRPKVAMVCKPPKRKKTPEEPDVKEVLVVSDEEDTQPTPTPYQELPPSPGDPTENDLNSIKRKIESHLDVKVSRIKKINQGYQVRLDTDYCEIIKGKHDRKEGRCVTIGRTGCTYTCLDTDCSEKKKKLKKLYTSSELKEMFPPPQKKQRTEYTGKLKAHHHLLLYLYQLAADLDLYRGGDHVYQLQKNSFGHSTGYYKSIGTIKEWIFENTRQDKNMLQWVNRTKSLSQLDSVVKELRDAPHDGFKKLNRSFRCWSYRNGQLDGETMEWKCYGETTKFEHASSKYFDVVVPDEVISLFENEQKEELKAWIPKYVKILRDQEWSESVIDALLSLLGRLYHPSNSDNLQCTPLIYGEAGSGKSSIIKAFTDTKEFVDIGPLNNSGHETMFGLFSIYEKHVHVCDEVDESFALPQTQWQQMVSGNGAMTLNIKNVQGGKMIPHWINRGIYSGNTKMKYINDKGQVSRRLVEFAVTKKIKTDTHLLKEIEENEVPYLPFVLLLFYQDLQRRNDTTHGDIKTLLPAELFESEQGVLENHNSLYSFFNSGNIEFGPKDNTYVPLGKFREAYQAYCKMFVLRVLILDDPNNKSMYDTLGVVLHKNPTAAEKNFTNAKELRRKWPRDDPNATSHHSGFFFGCDLVKK